MEESRVSPPSLESLSRNRSRHGNLGTLTPARTRLLALAAFLLLSYVALAALPAGAESPSVVSVGNGWIRFAQFVPSAGPVDVKIDGTMIATHLSFRGVTGYAMVSAGVHSVTVMSSSAKTGAAPLVKDDATVPNGGAITVTAVASTGVKTSAQGSVAGGMALQVFRDDLSSPHRIMRKCG